MSSAEGQQHPLGIYFKIWILLFVLSGFSYAVDYFNVQGGMRWALVILFMFLKNIQFKSLSCFTTTSIFSLYKLILVIKSFFKEASISKWILLSILNKIK